MSRSKPKKQRRSTSQKILWLVSLLLVASMVISLIIVALQAPDPVSQPEEPVMGPELSTDTPGGGSEGEVAPTSSSGG